uniref:Putative secreted protein n=1 Tax=Rhipicephalus microplus TaxID=6941 RepID=A0A6M2D9J2_RHIMP
MFCFFFFFFWREIVVSFSNYKNGKLGAEKWKCSRIGLSAQFGVAIASLSTSQNQAKEFCSYFFLIWHDSDYRQRRRTMAPKKKGRFDHNSFYCKRMSKRQFASVPCKIIG